MIVDSGARLSKRMEDESFKKELMGIQKSDMHNKFMHDVRILVRDKCSADWESWRAVPEEIKTHLVDDDPNLMKCIDSIFKLSFWE
ncbi:hypothetical protein D8674_004124 [Pyrus ussuriensis x Pyrus communis]|uniref:Uncharacterized protein n=1 Tax=Pyrus ussuriensis x Pyrus communis TaxID=2448454 RepID=A0A5N5FJ08_9ROSA|nr:hypothetical protein D8674_004124 [Pyrus ussuriensis x Pyrus communis]